MTNTSSMEGARGQAPPGRADSGGSSPDPEARTRLLDAAQELFSSRGFDATRTKQIADRAGVSNGLLFYYFPTKQQLLEALIDERSFVRELHTYLEVACARERDDPRETLIEIGHRLLQFLRENQELVRIMVQAPLAEDDSPFQPLRRALQTGMDGLADYLDGLVQRGRLAPSDTRVLARMFISSVAFTVIAPLPRDTDDYVATAADLLLHQAPAAPAGATGS
jgi:AcrR family transcriptional regulator